jgi:transcriptional repressor NrdR
MRCPHCDSNENRVVDTRSSRGGRALRRRRECLDCGGRFTTYEYVEERPIQILKASGNAEDFDRGKLLRSVQLACVKRPVSASAIDALVDRVEDQLSRQAGVEIPSSRVGELVMEGLKPLDRVAYVRFASVYRNFQDIDEFQELMAELEARRDAEFRARNQVELPFS